MAKALLLTRFFHKKAIRVGLLKQRKKVPLRPKSDFRNTTSLLYHY